MLGSDVNQSVSTRINYIRLRSAKSISEHLLHVPVFTLKRSLNCLTCVSHIPPLMLVFTSARLEEARGKIKFPPQRFEEDLENQELEPNLLTLD